MSEIVETVVLAKPKKPPELGGFGKFSFYSNYWITSFLVRVP